MHLKLNYRDVPIKEHKHAQEIMRDLGIKYSHSTPQSLYDSFWFWNCTNIPAKLPKYISRLKVNPMDAIGYGLSKEKAEEIIRIQNGQLNREQDCPKCGSDSQVWINQITGRKTCHRACCNTEIR